MQTFHPHPLLRNGHLQTLCAAFGPGQKAAASALQHRVRTSDGDTLVVHEDPPHTRGAEPAAALLIHGLAGSHRSPYMVRIAAKLAARGVHVFRLDLRGCGAGVSQASRPSHAGRSEDVAAAVQSIQQRLPRCRLTLLGFSLGGNQLLKLLGEWSDQHPACVQRALAVAPPVDLHACSRNIQRPSRRLYNRWFVRRLNRDLPRYRAAEALLQNGRPAPPPRTLYAFDDRFTAPLGGFRNADDYYHRASAGGLLARIRLPTVILAARDDPIVPFASLETAAISPSTRIVATRYGGHLGFLGRRSADPDRWWLDWRAVEFVTQSEAF